MNIPAWAIVPLAPLAFVGFWCFVCWLISMQSGWKALASRFRSSHKPFCNVASMQSGFLNSARYNGVLGVGVCDEGLYLAVLFFFRVGHPPLLIPWNELSQFKESKMMWLTLYTTTIEIERFKKVTIGFYDRALVEQIEEKIGRL